MHVNRSHWGLWLLIPFLISCTEAVPEGFFEGLLYSKPAVQGEVSELRINSLAPVSIPIPGTCDDISTSIEVSLDSSNWVSASGSDVDCSDGSFTLNLDINNAVPPNLMFSGTPDPETIPYYIRTQTSYGATDSYVLNVIYDSSYTGPSINLTNLPVSLTNQNTLAVAVDSTSALYYQYALQSTATACSSASFGADNLLSTSIIDSVSDGNNRLCVRGKDLAGVYGSGANIAEYDWTVDTVPPSVLSFLGGVPGGLTNDPNLNVSFSSPDAVSIKTKVIASAGDCTLSSGYSSEVPLATGLITTMGADGSYKICAVGKDSAANWMAWSNSVSSSSFTLDRVAPTVSLSSSVTNPTTSSFVVNINFSESVTGLTSTDFTGTAAASLTLSGSGAAYSLTVNPSVDGEVYTISLPAGAAQDLAGNNSLASSPAINTQYVIPKWNFASASSNPGEAAGAHNIIINLSAAPSSMQMINYTVTDGTATGSGVDYTMASGSATIFAGQTVATISAAINNDVLVEGDEDFSITLSGPSGGSILGTVLVHTVTIVDDDSVTPLWDFSLASSSPLENVGTHNIVINLIPAPSANKTINYTVAAGTATGGGTDYTMVNGTATVLSGQTVATISASINDDILDEDDETFSVSLSSPAAGTSLGSTLVHTVTIQDNDVVPTLNFSSGTGSVAENVAGGIYNLNFSLSAPSGRALSFSLSDLGTGTASNPADFSFTAGSITIPAGNSTYSIPVSIVNDGLYEGAETIDFQISAPVNATIGGVNNHTLTLNESLPHGPASQVVITTQPPGVVAAGSSIPMVVEIRDAFGNLVSTGAGSTQSVSLSIFSGPPASLNGTVSIAAVAGIANFSGPNIELAGGGYSLSASISSPAVNVTSNSFVVTNASASQLVFTTQPIDPTTAGANIYLDLRVEDAFGNIVVTGVDSTAGISLSLISGTGTLGGTISKSFSAGVVSFSGTDGVNIDIAGSGKVIRATKANTTGGGGTGALTVDSNSFTINPGLAPYTWTGLAGDNLWSTSTNWSTNVAPSSGDIAKFTDDCSGGNCNVTIDLPVTVDGLDIQSSYTGTISLGFNLNINSEFNFMSGTLTGASKLISVGGDVNIGSSASGGSVDLLMYGPSESINSAANLPFYNVEFDPGGGGTINQNTNLNLFSGGSFTLSNGKFLQNGLNINATGSLFINAGAKWVQSCGVISVGGVTNNGIIATGNEVTISINDPVDGFEGATANFIVSIDQLNCENTYFDFATAFGSAMPAIDYIANTDVGVFIPSAQTTYTIPVSTVNDSLYENTEYFTVDLSGLSPGVIAGDISGMYNILDDDNANKPVLNISSTSVNEGVSAALVVSLNTISGVDVYFDWATSDFTANQPSDYVASSGSGYSILAGSLSVTLPAVTTVDDGIGDPGEQFQINVSNILGADAGTIIGLVTLNEVPPKQIYRSVGPGNTSILACGTNGGGCIGQGSVTIAGSTATFASALPLNIGVGDAVVYDCNSSGTLNSGDCIAFISSRTSSLIYTLANAAGAAPTPYGSAAVWRIYRAYTSLSSALNGSPENSSISTINAALGNFDTWIAGKNIVASNEAWNISMYADSPDTNSADLSSSWITDSARNIRIFAPSLSSEVGKSQRHIGEFNGPYAGMKRISAAASIDITALFVSIEGLVFVDTLGNGGPSSISANTFSPGKISIISNIFVKDESAGNSSTPVELIDSSGIGTIFNLINNQFLLIESTHCLSINKGVSRVYNNEFLACGISPTDTAIYLEGGAGQTASFVNNIFYEPESIVTQVFSAINSPILNNENNLSKVALNYGSDLNTIVGSPNFSNPDDFDFKLLPGSLGISTGKDLSADINFPFNVDLMNRNRPSGQWDIGAYQNENSSSVKSDLMELRADSYQSDAFKVEAYAVGDNNLNAAAYLKYCEGVACDASLSTELGMSHGFPNPNSFSYDVTGLVPLGTEREFNMIIRYADPDNGADLYYYRKLILYPAGTIQISSHDVHVSALSDTEMKIELWFEGDTISPATFEFYYCDTVVFGPSCDPIANGTYKSLSKTYPDSVEDVIGSLIPSRMYKVRLVVSDAGLSSQFIYNSTVTTLGPNYMRLDGLFVYNYSSGGNSLQVRVPFLDPNSNNTGINLYICNRTDNSDCNPVEDGQLFVMTPSAGEYNVFISGLSGYGFDLGDRLSFEAVGSDPDGVGNQGVRREVTLQDGGMNNINLQGINIFDLNASQFTAELNFSGDENGNSSVALWYCSETDSPGCDPLSGIQIPMARNDFRYYVFTDSIPGAFSSDTINVKVVATDVDGVTGSPYQTSFVLSPPPPPPNPINLQLLAISDTIMDIGWESGGGNTIGYQIVYNTGSVPPNCYSGSVIDRTNIWGSSFRLEGLVPNTNYGFRVCAVNNGSPATLSDGSTTTGMQWTLSTPSSFIPPESPNWINLQAMSNTSIRVNWWEDDGDYRIAWQQGSLAPVNCSSASNFVDIPNNDYTVFGLSQGTQYAFRVCGKNGAYYSVGTTGTQWTSGNSGLLDIIETSALEGNSLNFYVKISKPAVSDVTVNWSTANDSASAGSDYVSGSGAVTITTGMDRVALPGISTMNDGIGEGVERMRVDINSIDASVRTASSYGYIVENDPLNWASGVNGNVLATAYDSSNERRFLGGDFTVWDQSVNQGIALVKAGGNEEAAFVSGAGFGGGAVKAIVVQPDGKIVVGGSFNKYKGTSVNRLVRLNLDGSLDSGFVSNIGTGPGAMVSALAVDSQGKVYVGGTFADFNGDSSRRSIVRLNSNGTIDSSFNPVVSSYTLSAIAVDAQDRILIGGFFPTYPSDSNYSYLVRLNSDGNVDTSLPSTNAINSEVKAIAIHQNGFVIGGSFSSPMSRLMRFDSSGNPDGAFNANIGAPPNNDVFALAVGPDNSVYVGGSFTDFLNILDGVGKLDSSGTKNSSFNNFSTGFTNASSMTVRTLAYHQGLNRLLVGGDFDLYQDSITSYNVKNIAVLDPSSGNLDNSFNQGTGATGVVNSIVPVVGNKLLVGGTFNTYGGFPQGRIVALDSAGGRDSSFNGNMGLGADGPINAITITSTNRVVVGGSFTMFNSVARSNLAAVDFSGFFDGSFVGPSLATGQVNALKEYNNSGAYLLVAGEFTSPKSRFLRLDMSGGYTAAGFNSNISTGANAAVYSIAVDSSNNIFLGGDFTMASTYSSVRVAKYSAAGVLSTGYGGSGFDATVRSIAYDGTNLIVGGAFSTYNGTGGYNRLIKINTTGSGTAVLGYSNLDGIVNSVIVGPSSNIYIAGTFTAYGGNSSYGLAKIASGGSFITSYSFNGPSMVPVYSLTYIPETTNKLLFGSSNQIIHAPPQFFSSYGELLP